MNLTHALRNLNIFHGLANDLQKYRIIKQVRRSEMIRELWWQVNMYAF